MTIFINGYDPVMEVVLVAVKVVAEVVRSVYVLNK